MLKGLSPLLSPDLLHALASMGHGDELLIVDANFPAATHARRLLRLPGVSATEALEAVLSVLPLDDFGPQPALSMQVVGDPTAVPEIVPPETPADLGGVPLLLKVVGVSGDTASFDVVFVDPPYALVEGSRALAALAACVAPGGVAVVEHDATTASPAIAGLVGADRREYGSTGVTFYRRG